MNVPYSWLREFLPALPGPEETAELLTGIGLGCEAVHDYPGAPAGTVVVRLEQLEPVPDSDHLQLGKAWDGSRHWQVVTGAPNAVNGMLTAFAPPGTYLPALGADIGVRVLAGLNSEGMLCSARELGIYDHAAGLLELPADLEPGTALAELWPGDTILELEITPNRADAFSIMGVARDLAARLDQPLELPFTVGLAPEVADSDGTVSIDNRDLTGSPHFTLRRVSGLKVAASPLWLQRRLAMVGLRPRSNVIDVTNYVNFELGQPSHAYDLRALPGGTIGVRRATAGEKLSTLGGDELELHEQDLVIAAGDRALGLAGVIGGLHDSVRDDTTEIALEVAFFDPVTVRRTARRHAQHTDAHYRFERGVDPNLAPLASARICALLTELAGGQPAGQLVVSGGPQPLKQLSFRPSRVEFLTAVDVPLADQERYLTALGFSVDKAAEDHWQVTAPSWRFDMAIEEDVIEEVIRLHGFEHIGSSTPHMQFVPSLDDVTHRRLRASLASFGFQELISYSFTGDAHLRTVRAPAAAVRLSDPQGQESAVLRTMLYPSLLDAAVLNRQRTSLALFEVGHVFNEEETERVALLLSGDWIEPGWRKQGVRADAFVLKGLVERLAAGLGATVELRNAPFDPLHPGISAQVIWNGQAIGFLGQLHPEIASELGIRDTFICELDLPLTGQPVKFAEPGRQERVERDLALITPDTVSFASLRELLTGPAGPQLESLAPFDVYRGERIGAGRQSIALRFVFRHPERPLTDAEVTEHMTNVISTARNAGYDVRDS